MRIIGRWSRAAEPSELASGIPEVLQLSERSSRKGVGPPRGSRRISPLGCSTDRRSDHLHLAQEVSRLRQLRSGPSSGVIKQSSSYSSTGTRSIRYLRTTFARIALDTGRCSGQSAHNSSIARFHVAPDVSEATGSAPLSTGATVLRLKRTAGCCTMRTSRVTAIAAAPIIAHRDARVKVGTTAQ